MIIHLFLFWACRSRSRQCDQTVCLFVSNLAVYNDEKAKQIAERANQLAYKHLTFESMQCYAGLLLLEYSDLLNIKIFEDII